jgi:radical SAM protein with 4Fe4S-binding SPASM domain
MFRLSNLIASVLEGRPSRVLNGSIAIWNFTNRCNLNCLHCYSKASLDEIDALDTDTIMRTLPQLENAGVKFIIFSGGEPLVRKDIYDIAEEAKRLGIVTYLSSNGLYVTSHNAEKILDTFDYVGISIDGNEEAHDRFRGLKGAFRETIKAVDLLNSYGKKKVGIRFTMTKETIADLPFIFELVEKHRIPKLYLSHLVYSGRGLENLKMDLGKAERRKAMELILSKAFCYYERDVDIEIVTGNMEPDAALFYERFKTRYPAYAEEMMRRLKAWGGNSAGRKLLNIDSRGNVKPDPFFPVTLGNIREKPFETIWNDEKNELLRRLREHPRRIKGRCGDCGWLEVCNGGSRSRAYAVSGDLWAEDPACYLDDAMIMRRKTVETEEKDNG